MSTQTPQMFTALVIIAKYPSMNEWTNKMWSIHKIEYDLDRKIK